MHKEDFKKWYENYQKTEQIRNPSALYVCMEFADNWETDLDIIKENAWNECKQFEYATKKQFNKVFNAYYIDEGETQKLAGKIMDMIINDRKK